MQHNASIIATIPLPGALARPGAPAGMQASQSPERRLNPMLRSLVPTPWKRPLRLALKQVNNLLKGYSLALASPA